ncbi:hypothetical protein SERLA73DRAFT_149037 [Serpula lacrymans var. lacrymans S7.3]|uniref:Uncharacterized protein n=2 Tax=Serpula lacrymans var. lacrymans TaxID=341189 RepID=F8PHV8_SERL3|nr:uncharacterized protein SERLADRAFT_432022 [Serpula lacrymans var. lacrymans S7.9]EGO04587.1 hypothetical protein SERLA73DRAFT_149037 [Serpula lacrymans var. lacrymans S7.3]EGO30463.1 hypothetical protein SERLADRAFT_432022 [Serpula lacrymans var. lacrymans S7.9]
MQDNLYYGPPFNVAQAEDSSINAGVPQAMPLISSIPLDQLMIKSPTFNQLLKNEYFSETVQKYQLVARIEGLLGKESLLVDKIRKAEDKLQRAMSKKQALQQENHTLHQEVSKLQTALNKQSCSAGGDKTG